MTMRNTLFLMILAGVALQSSWAGDKTATGEGGLLPPPPPGPFMSMGEGSNPPDSMPAGMPRFDFPEQSWEAMPPIEAMSEDWPKDGFHAPADIPPPPEFPAWDSQAMPPMPQDMGDYPDMDNMPPPEFPAWADQGMPPMPQDMGDYPDMGEMPPSEFPAWDDQGMPEMPPMKQDWPEMGSGPAGMPPMPEFNPPPPPSYRMRPPEYRGYQRPQPMPGGGYSMPPQGYPYQGPPGWGGPTYGVSPYVE